MNMLFLMNKTKDQISWVSSHDLYWENKMYKRKRSINPRSVRFHQCHAKPHSICFFYHIIKDNERNLFQDLLTIETTDSGLKVHALHYANELLVRVRLSFQKLLQNRSTYRNNTKNGWEKSNDAYSLSIRVQTTINHISIFTFLCFYDNINVELKKMFSFRARAEKGIAQHIDASSVVGTSNFWLARSEHAHASYPGLFFRPPRVQPLYGAGRKESSGTGLDSVMYDVCDGGVAYFL